MAIISFENIVDGESIEVPDGYRDLIWKNVWAVNEESIKDAGFGTRAVHSGEAAAYNAARDSIGFKSPDRDEDFDFSSGYFATFNATDLKVKVAGFDDGERVATKVLLLDPEQEFVTFGRKFNDIDEVKIKVSGGTDANPNDNYPLMRIFAIDDLFIDF